MPIQAEFGLGDKALSAFGVVFGLFYATIAIPIAWLADRRNRVSIIAASIALWSLFTAACGLAQNYTQLFLARMGVGVRRGGRDRALLCADRRFLSEETGGRGRWPSSRSAFRSARRSASSSAAGSPPNCRWRSAFMIVGLAGLPTALLVRR